MSFLIPGISSSGSNSKTKYPVVKLSLAGSRDKGLCRRVVCNKQNVACILEILKERAIELHTSAAAGRGGLSGGGLSSNGDGVTRLEKNNKNCGSSLIQKSQQQQQQYTVQLKYTDADGDKCALLSNADVVDALHQFKNQPSFKVMAKVMSSSSSSHKSKSLSSRHLRSALSAPVLVSPTTTSSSSKMLASAMNAVTVAKKRRSSKKRATSVTKNTSSTAAAAAMTLSATMAATATPTTTTMTTPLAKKQKQQQQRATATATTATNTPEDHSNKTTTTTTTTNNNTNNNGGGGGGGGIWPFTLFDDLHCC